MAKQVSPGVLALRKVVDDVYADAREAKKQGKLVGWSSSKFPCELAEAFDLNVMYPENQAAGIAAQRDGEIMCQAAEDLGFDNDICGYARISLAYAAGKRASRKFDPETLEFIIDPNSGKPLKDENGKVVIDPETGKPKKDPKTQVPYTVLDDIHEIEALPETTEKEIAYKNFRREAIKPYKQMRIPQPDFVLCCNNICNCMTKWYENIARMCNIPLIMVDIPYNNTVEVSDSAVKYVRAQFDNAIHELEKLTGKKFDEKKFELACKHVGHLVHGAQLVHDQLADVLGADLALEGVLQGLLDLVCLLLKHLERNGALFARADHAVQDLALVKALAAAVLFDDDHRQALHRFIGGEALGAGKALSPAADAAALFGRAGINDLALFVSAIGAFHRAVPLFTF